MKLILTYSVYRVETTDTTEMTMDYESIKRTLVDLAMSHNLTAEDLNAYSEEDASFDWHIDWKSDLNFIFSKNVDNLGKSIELYQNAMATNDLITAQVGLLRAGVSSHNLMSFFDALRHDLNRAIIDPRFHWPEIPEDYKIPSKYGFNEK
jgi:hypothetical protein